MPKKNSKKKKKIFKQNDENTLLQQLKENGSDSSAIDIGSRNICKWNTLKHQLQFSNDVDFVEYMLKTVEREIRKKHTVDECNKITNFKNINVSIDCVSEELYGVISKLHRKEKKASSKYHKLYSRKKHDIKKIKKQNFNENALSFININQIASENFKENDITENEDKKKESEEKEKENTILNLTKEPDQLCTNSNQSSSDNIISLSLKDKIDIGDNKSTEPENYSENNSFHINENACANEDISNYTCFELYSGCDKPKSVGLNTENKDKNQNLENISLVRNIKKQKKFIDDSNKNKKKLKNHDIRKAPQLEFTSSNFTSNEFEKNGSDKVKSADSKDTDRVAIKIKLCYNCNTRHIQKSCPLLSPVEVIEDSVPFEKWHKKNSCYGNKVKTKYADASLPSVCYLKEVNEKHGNSVFVNCDIKKYTQFGPLIGPRIREKDIPDDFNMKHIWEVSSEDQRFYINTEDRLNSNWVRYVRPAETRDKRNVCAVVRNNSLYLISCQKINNGEELCYWLDDISTVGRRKLEKTNCGGCNLTFDHALYYRIHCSVFHDTRYSLTIRKYHCKICGEAVLGKDNIVRHAAELHNGQGAYQCQYCQKFFLRLNYLEMHRTYGCAANPQRARPLCDFCGRKFCQPQKLKVHIKRMHSNISLREFQCSICLKLLGSRAAVQRHAREVHRSSIEGPSSNSNSVVTHSLSCSRCGKFFQNKSNLKIHMLTHSGVKPFKCKEGNCNAAFTTKQCLQFHYKKVHGFSEDNMPTIVRSVEYTFAAYSGGAAPDDNNTENSCTSQDKAQKNDDEIPTLNSPVLNINEHSVETPPILTECLTSTVVSKGSKKWIGNDNANSEHDMNSDDSQKNDNESLESQLDNERTKLNMCLNVYNARHDSSNASLLVEAALDSVSDINMGPEPDQTCASDIPMEETPNCLNLYSLSQQELEVERDMGLLSTVTEHDAHSLEYAPFSTETSPVRLIHEYVVRNEDRNRSEYLIGEHQSVQSPSRYELNQNAKVDTLSNDSESAQNLTTSSKNKESIEQLEFGCYKAHYDDLDSTDLSMKKYDARSKFDIDSENRANYNLVADVSEDRQSYDSAKDDMHDKQYISEDRSSNVIYSDVLETDELKNSHLETDPIRSAKYDFESKYDSEFRSKCYDITEEDIRNKTAYSGLDTETRLNKPYSILENSELRSKSYESLIDIEFRSDRSFEPLILNPSELQGLDMSARGYHSFHASSSVSRYHHVYPEPEPYGSPADVLRVVSLDLTPQTRLHHTLHANTRLLQHNRLALDHNLSVSTLFGTDGRLLSDHTASRILSNDQLSDSRLGSPDSHRRGFSTYSTSFHPPTIGTRSHIASPVHNTTYHHYSGYY